MSDFIGDLARKLQPLPGPSPINGMHWEVTVTRSEPTRDPFVTLTATWRLVPTLTTEEDE